MLGLAGGIDCCSGTAVLGLAGGIVCCSSVGTAMLGLVADIDCCCSVGAAQLVERGAETGLVMDCTEPAPVCMGCESSSVHVEDVPSGDEPSGRIVITVTCCAGFDGSVVANGRSLVVQVEVAVKGHKVISGEVAPIGSPALPALVG